MLDPFVLLVAVIVLAVVFDYINGFHDTANAIATVVSTNVLSPRSAILMAAAFNFVGAFLGTGVAETIGGGIADPISVTQTVVLAALAGAILWNLVTWYFAIPSSSSHALVGGIVGAVWGHRVLDENAGAGATLYTLATSSGVTKVALALVCSPLAGLLIGLIVMGTLLWIIRHVAPARVNRAFRSLQLVSAASMALSHGSNDAQKAMGICTMALLAYYSRFPKGTPGWLDLSAWQQDGAMHVPTWVIVLCATAMAMGTAAGGWRIMKTVGHKIIRLRPIHGFAAESAAATVILLSSALHAPVSTTHVISSAIMGVGASKRASAVRWGVAGHMFVAWVLTIPVSAVVALVVYVGARSVLGG